VRLLLAGRLQVECGILGAVMGSACDTIELDLKDVYRMVELTKTENGRLQLMDWLGSALLCRFVRPYRRDTSSRVQ
jgi:hypothetical protein